MTLDLPSSLDASIKEDRKWADSLLGKTKSKKLSNKEDVSKTADNKKRKKHVKEEDNVVVVTDLRPIADRLHEKDEQAAAARKRKKESGEQPPPKKVRSDKKSTNKHQKDKRNGITTTSSNKHKPVAKPIQEEESDDELLEEESEVIHIDDYYNELTERVLNASYSSPHPDSDDDVDDDDEDTEEYDEDIRRRLLGIKKPESAISPELEEEIQYGTFDFSTGQPIPKYLTKGAKRTKRLEYLLKKAERRKKVLASNSERADQIRWSSALSKASGVKDFEDTAKMKKLLKKISSKKKKSREEWSRRIEDTKSKQERKQAKRRANISAKVASRKTNKINRRFGIKTKKKSNRSSPNNNKKRPGFEGRKQTFLNK